MTVEQVKALRDAFLEGARHALCQGAAGYFPSHRVVEAEALRRYPMPMVEVPRVAEVPEPWAQTRVHRFRLVNGEFQTMRPDHTEWEPYKYGDHVRAIADLLANPTEQRPADEVQGA